VSFFLKEQRTFSSDIYRKYLRISYILKDFLDIFRDNVFGIDTNRRHVLSDIEIHVTVEITGTGSMCRCNEAQENLYHYKRTDENYKNNI
jgi:hypothetical protein